METATSIELFVEILDRYVYYFDQQNESVSFKDPKASSLNNMEILFAISSNSLISGYNKISKWAHRAHTLKFGRKSARFWLNRDKQKAFPPNTREHQKQTVRRGGS